MRFFCSHFLHLSNTYRPNNIASEFFRFCSWIRWLISIFYIRQWLCWHGVSFLVHWVNAKWDSTSTVSMQSETPRHLSQRGIIKSSLIFVSSTLTQLTCSLTPCWLSWWRIWLHVNSVWRRWVKPKQAYITSSSAFKGIGFRKINDEMFKWGQYQPENVNSFYTAWIKKLTLH